MSFLCVFDTLLLYHSGRGLSQKGEKKPAGWAGRSKMASACALAIFSGIIIFNFTSPKRLRSFRRCFFTERGRTGKRHLCQKAQKTAGRTPSVKPCGFATSLWEGGNPLRHRCAMPPPPKGGGLLHLTGRRKAPSLRGLSPQATGGVCPERKKPRRAALRPRSGERVMDFYL